MKAPHPKDSEAEDAGRVPRRVWSSTALLLLGRAWGSGCTLAILWLLARPETLGATAFGRFTFWLAVFAVLDSLAEFGTGQVAVQKTANDPAAVPAVLSAARRIRFAMGALGVLLVGGGAVVTGEPGAGWILLASLYPVTHVLELSATVFKNRIAWSVPVATRAFASGLGLALVLAMLAASVRGPALYLLAVAAGSTTANFVLHSASKKYLRAPSAAMIPPVREIWHAAWPLGLAGLCQQLYFYVDNLFIRGMIGEEALGPYNVAVRVMSWCIAVAVFATATALPWLTREFAAGRLLLASTKLAMPLVALAGIGTAALWPFADELLGLFGPEFESAAPSLRWLLLATVCIYGGAAYLTGVVAAGRTRSVLVIASTALLVNLILNTVLVPRFGITGAAQATCATEFSVLLLSVLSLRSTKLPA
ncbi:MAG: oligosaccharide flippase family protein [Planctomycetota bacterium]